MKTTDKQPAAKMAKKPAPKKETRPVSAEAKNITLARHKYLIQDGGLDADTLEKLIDLHMYTNEINHADPVRFWAWADAVDQVMEAKARDRDSAPLALATEVDNLTTGVVSIADSNKGEIDLMVIAAAIRMQYEIAIKGIVAWTKMGLLLVATRNTFPPRGGFVEWMTSEFSALSRSSLYNAIQAAEGLLIADRGNRYHLGVSETDYMDQLSQKAFGKSRRLLMAEAKESRNGESEDRAKAEVEKLFELYPDKREIWVPLVESGERTWADALKGITGAVASVNEDGTRRTREAYLPLFEKLISVPASLKHAGKWDAIPVDKQPNIIDAAAELMAFIPATCREVVLKKLAEKEAALNA